MGPVFGLVLGSVLVQKLPAILDHRNQESGQLLGDQEKCYSVVVVMVTISMQRCATDEPRMSQNLVSAL